MSCNWFLEFGYHRNQLEIIMISKSFIIFNLETLGGGCIIKNLYKSQFQRQLTWRYTIACIWLIFHVFDWYSMYLFSNYNSLHACWFYNTISFVLLYVVLVAVSVRFQTSMQDFRILHGISIGLWVTGSHLFYTE